MNASLIKSQAQRWLIALAVAMAILIGAVVLAYPAFSTDTSNIGFDTRSPMQMADPQLGGGAGGGGG